MRQLLVQNSLHEKRRNMSKRGFDLATDSNASRTLFDIHFKAFDSPMRKTGEPFESPRIRSNVLEGVAEASDA
jgi:hypothetical protein